MRINISLDWFGWIYKLDRKKIILIAFLARFICASAYDVSVAVAGKEALLPDGKFYSICGRYIQIMMNGYSRESLTFEMVPSDAESRSIFRDIVLNEGVYFSDRMTGTKFFLYLIGLLYFIFGYHTIAIRLFNILLAIGSVYLFFKIAEKRFGKLTANLFLLIALFLPSQFGYSITLSRDFIRTFVIALILWGIYG